MIPKESGIHAFMSTREKDLSNVTPYVDNESLFFGHACSITEEKSETVKGLKYRYLTRKKHTSFFTHSHKETGVAQVHESLKLFGKGIKVGVVDSGIDYKVSPPISTGKIITDRNFFGVPIAQLNAKERFTLLSQ
jgi:hypothetical protein